MRVLLAYKSHEKGAEDPFTSLLPTGLCSLHAILRSTGHQSTLANLSTINWREISSLLASHNPEVLGISQFTHNRFESLRLAALAKEKNPACIVVFGGPHATHSFREILLHHPEVDAVVLGEGEATLSELLDTLATGDITELGGVKGIAFRKGDSIILTPPREPIADLDGLPTIANFTDSTVGVDLLRQLEFIITSRGCPAACTFCSSPSFWGKGLRFRSPRSIVSEIRHIRDRHGVLYFSVRDDTFTTDKGRVMEFCRLLLEEKLYILWNCQSRVNAVDKEMLLYMKRAGCECVQFGVESGSPSMLRILGKKITPEQILRAADATRQAGINLSVYLITGVPEETETDLQATVELIQRIKPHDGQVSPLAYYPGTPLFNAAVRSGKLSREIFEKDRHEAFYVRDDPFVLRSKKTLMRTLGRAAIANRFRAEDFLAQKSLLGFSSATNMLAGEQYEGLGEWRAAEREYKEIVDLEPENPWGWLLLGELYGSLADPVRGRKAYEQVLRLAPSHTPALTALGELSLVAGNRGEAASWFQRALCRNPFDETAREGLLSAKK